MLRAAAASPQLLRRLRATASAFAPQLPLWAQPGSRLLHRRRLVERSELGYSRTRGRVPAEVLFVEQSKHNGVVRVTKHGRWLALTFDASEQGLSYCGQAGEPGYADGAAQPDVCAFEYTRAMAAALVGFQALQRENDSTRTLSGRVLCVGLGSGTLPAFLAHHCGSTAAVQVVELDETVIRLCRDVLRVQLQMVASLEKQEYVRGFSVLHADGEAALSALAQRVRSGDDAGCNAIVLDAYDASARVPAHMQQPRFLAAVAGCLAPSGVLVVNLFNGRPDGEEVCLLLLRQFGAAPRIHAPPPARERVCVARR